MGLRDVRAQARKDLHEHMGVLALYISPTGEETPCRVRVHTKFVQLGQQKGTNFNSAETEDEAPRLIFWRDEVTPENKGAVTIHESFTMTGHKEAYRIGVVLPPDGQTVTARVSMISEAKMADLPFREIE